MLRKCDDRLPVHLESGITAKAALRRRLPEILVVFLGAAGAAFVPLVDARAGATVIGVALALYSLVAALERHNAQELSKRQIDAVADYAAALSSVMSAYYSCRRPLKSASGPNDDVRIGVDEVVAAIDNTLEKYARVEILWSAGSGWRHADEHHKVLAIAKAIADELMAVTSELDGSRLLGGPQPDIDSFRAKRQSLVKRRKELVAAVAGRPTCSRRDTPPTAS